MTDEQRLELIKKNLREVEKLTEDIMQLAMGDDILLEVSKDLNHNISDIRDNLEGLQPKNILTIKECLENIEDNSRDVVMQAHGDHNLLDISKTIHLDVVAMLDYVETWTNKENG